MKKLLEKLWDDYLLCECAVAESEQEHALSERTAVLHDALGELLNEQQGAAVHRYVDALCEMEALFVKKAFLKGCELAAAILTDAESYHE